MMMMMKIKNKKIKKSGNYLLAKMMIIVRVEML